MRLTRVPIAALAIALLAAAQQTVAYLRADNDGLKSERG
jgi:hypothetical protein